MQIYLCHENPGMNVPIVDHQQHMQVTRVVAATSVAGVVYLVLISKVWRKASNGSKRPSMYGRESV